MENINFKVINIDDNLIDFDIFEEYYSKFKSIYGETLVDALSSSMTDLKNKYDLLIQSTNYKKTMDAIKDIDNKTCSLYGILSNNNLLGIARVYESDNELLIPDTIFRTNFTIEEQYFLYNEFIIYLEKYLGKKVYFEIAHKDMDLSRLLLNNDYELIIEDTDKYDLAKTFLMRRK
jgi:hypothetical protein